MPGGLRAPMSTSPCSPTPSASVTPTIRPGFPSCSDQTPESIISSPPRRPVSHLRCKISSAVSFRNKYLQPLRWQEKETSGDFPPFLPARAGPPAGQGCRGQLAEGLEGPSWMSPGLPGRQEESSGPLFQRSTHTPYTPRCPRKHPWSLWGHTSLNMSLRAAWAGTESAQITHAGLRGFHTRPVIAPGSPLCPLAVTTCPHRLTLASLSGT